MTDQLTNGWRVGAFIAGFVLSLVVVARRGPDRGDYAAQTSAFHVADASVTSSALYHGDKGSVPSSLSSLVSGNKHIAAADTATKARISATYGRLPMQFEANKGQTDRRVKFLTRGRGYTMFLTNQAETVLSLHSPQSAQGTQRKEEKKIFANSAVKGTVVRMKLVHANPAPEVSGAEKLPGKVNYFLGNDPKKWRTSVPTYEKVKYESV